MLPLALKQFCLIDQMPKKTESKAVPVKRPPGRQVGTIIVPPEAQKLRVNVMLDPEHQDIARLAGDGNLSAGLRIALDVWAKANAKKKPLRGV